MPELKPCTRCNGSGTEPDPITLAYDTLRSGIDGDASTSTLRHSAEKLREASHARITDLETILRLVLGHMSGDLPGDETWLRVPNTDVRNWRKVLDP